MVVLLPVKVAMATNLTKLTEQGGTHLTPIMVAPPIVWLVRVQGYPLQEVPLPPLALPLRCPSVWPRPGLEMVLERLREKVSVLYYV